MAESPEPPETAKGLPRAPWLLRVIAPVLIGTGALIQDMKVSGLENLPDDGGLIVVANHTAHLDFLSLGGPLYRAGRPPQFVAASEFFEMPIYGSVFPRVGAIPVYRESDDPAKVLDAARAALDKNGTVILFPEGTFGRDPEMWPMRGKTGAARLALSRPNVPVIPVAHWGNEHLYGPWDGKIAWSRLGRRRTKAETVFGAPIDMTRFEGREVTKELLDEVTEVFMSAIEDLLQGLRERNPLGMGTQPRERRWDIRVDGDPHAVGDHAHRESRRKWLDRWARIRRIFTPGRKKK